MAALASLKALIRGISCYIQNRLKLNSVLKRLRLIGNHTGIYCLYMYLHLSIILSSTHNLCLWQK